MNSFYQDVRFAVRGLRKNPAFTLIAVLVLALGTGSNTAIFSIFNAVLLRPLPFLDPDRVMLVTEKLPRRGIERTDLSAANFFDLEQRNQSFSALAILSGRGFALSGDNAAGEQVSGALVSAQFFNVLGVSPERGRNLGPEDERPGEPPVVMLSHGFWRRRFAGDPAIVGRSIYLNGLAHRVAGVMPEGFQALSHEQEIWVPMQLTSEEASNRISHFLWAIGRLKPGITPQQAQAELDTIGRSLERECPEANTGRGLRAAPLHQELVGDTRAALVLLMGAVSLLLLVACVNVANLLLSRALSRKKEMAIRRALGAGDARLVQQLVTEGFLLATLGVGAGLVVCRLVLRSLPLLIPSNASLPGLDRVEIDGSVLIATLIMGVCVSVWFACLPAWQLLYGAGGLGDRSTAGGVSRGRFPVRSVLLAIEMALSLVLVLGAGLLIRSFQKLMETKPGFQAEQVLTVQIQMPAQQALFFRQVQGQVHAIPSVEEVAAIDYLPLSGSTITRRLLVEGRARPEPGGEPIVLRHIVTPGYFRAIGIPLRKGRGLRETDLNSEHLVVMINETMARRYWPDQNPIGQYLRLGVQATVANATPREVVGVTGDVRHGALRVDPRDEVYVPLGQDSGPVMQLVVRASVVDPASLIPAVKAAVWTVDKNQTLPNLRPMTQIVSDSVWEPRLNTVVLAAFATVTLALALAGIYGLMTQIVGDRTAEIGIRMAMGARPRSVLFLVLRQGFLPVLIGVIAGLALTVGGGRLISSQLYGVSQADPLTFGAGVALIVTAAFLAMSHPALRAARVDPMIALRRD